MKQLLLAVFLCLVYRNVHSLESMVDICDDCSKCPDDFNEICENYCDFCK